MAFISTASRVRAASHRSRIMGFPCRRPGETTAPSTATTLAIRTPPKILRCLDHGPMQRDKSARDSFDAIRALERKQRRKWQVDLMLASPVVHVQRRDIPYATTANGQQRDCQLCQPEVELPQYTHCQRPPFREKSLGARYIVRCSRNADNLMGK